MGTRSESMQVQISALLVMAAWLEINALKLLNSHA
jgi:hypothetical protein